MTLPHGPLPWQALPDRFFEAWLPALSTASFRVYGFLLRHGLLLNQEPGRIVGVCPVSGFPLRQIAEHCHLSTEHVCTTLSRLEAMGLISRERPPRRTFSAGPAHIYHLHLDAFYAGPMKGTRAWERANKPLRRARLRMKKKPKPSTEEDAG